jgi:hypothetical protein
VLAAIHETEGRREIIDNRSDHGLAVASTAWTAVARTVNVHASSQKPHLSEQRIRRIAERWATRMEDPTPFLVQHSEGTRRKANLIAADDLIEGKEGEAWSYLIAERGHFVDRYSSYGVREPRSGYEPSGSVLVLIVNAGTGQLGDLGLANQYPNLAKLGPVRTDLRRSTRAARTHTQSARSATRGARSSRLDR